MTIAWLNRIGTAVPAHDIHAEFVAFGRTLLADEHAGAVFDRMAALAGIAHRYAIFAPGPLPRREALDSEGFYRRGAFPTTAQRMARFHAPALDLANRAVEDLRLSPRERAGITHLIVASCTGFSAPGLDFQLMRAARLRDSVERTMVGFMGCFAAVNALRLARYIVRSEPHARVLVVNVELSSLHLREEWQVAKLLSFMLFGDGASAAVVSAEPDGLALGQFCTEVVPGSDGLITWDIGDGGFEMHLSGQVPARIRNFARENGRALLDRLAVEDPQLWAVHAGGRTILDAVQDGLDLDAAALGHSRDVLRDFGNMSSATLMFVLARILGAPRAPGPGVGMAFGPGLTVESFAFHAG